MSPEGSVFFIKINTHVVNSSGTFKFTFGLGGNSGHARIESVGNDFNCATASVRKPLARRCISREFIDRILWSFARPSVCLPQPSASELALGPLFSKNATPTKGLTYPTPEIPNALSSSRLRWHFQETQSPTRRHTGRKFLHHRH